MLCEPELDTAAVYQQVFLIMSRTAPEQCEESRIRPVDSLHIAHLIRIGEETNLSPWSAQAYLEEMKNPNAILLRMVNSVNKNIGFVVGRLVTAGDTEVRIDAEIYNIAVVSAEQRRGCGQSLFDAFRDQCVKRDVSNIWLEVRESNARALCFYEKNGFERVQSRRHFYENPREHAILMRLPLKTARG
jgi:ribosomal-protein-alanine N-acetyltransferase